MKHTEFKLVCIVDGAFIKLPSGTIVKILKQSRGYVHCAPWRRLAGVSPHVADRIMLHPDFILKYATPVADEDILSGQAS